MEYVNNLHSFLKTSITLSFNIKSRDTDLKRGWKTIIMRKLLPVLFRMISLLYFHRSNLSS